jgi:hypothetical protein
LVLDLKTIKTFQDFRPLVIRIDDLGRAEYEPVAEVSRLVSIPVAGGLHHRYIRVAA